jgi:predicted HTH domain antitoxin
MGYDEGPAMAEQVTLQFPDGAFSALRRSPAEFADEVKRAAVCKWYELGVISQSKAAELLGVSRARLMELLSAYRVSPVQATQEELRAELERG